ncbi:hypothetical protein Rsub_09655 [Raphidocelis subcapitata]|uniref:Uncharacterized protein n=1 Tax=Raphidocelis subcapitata TaxID=307507 RepID=A0A2V0PB97_9CHLO|nr:hypothetical protein Rsub_09655 [Raphidocelis subcapitata]|eukprot:GBF96799.1 hypothetical protein Rsub_09655 [Raphidocelis subcapitata]
MGHADALRVLWQAGVDLDARGAYGVTPAQAAATMGHADALRVLWEAGVNLGERGPDGLTPAEDAALNGHAKALRVLREAGVSLRGAFQAALSAAQPEAALELWAHGDAPRGDRAVDTPRQFLTAAVAAVEEAEAVAAELAARRAELEALALAALLLQRCTGRRRAARRAARRGPAPLPVAPAQAPQLPRSWRALGALPEARIAAGVRAMLAADQPVPAQLPARVACGVLRALADARARARGLEGRVCGEAACEYIVQIAGALRGGTNQQA